MREATSVPTIANTNVNTADDEGTPFVSQDGLFLAFQSNRPGGAGSLDLWMSRRDSVDAPFGPPVNLGETINSQARDGSPSFTADACTVAFHSQRGAGEFQIWLASRPSIDRPWTAPVPLAGPAEERGVNFRPWLSPDGRTITFVRIHEGREGIWIARRKATDEPFEEPKPYGRFSHLQQIGGLSFTADGKIALVNRSQAQFPGNLLWLCRIRDDDQPFRNLRPFGPEVNGPHIDVDPAPAGDGAAVYFQSDRAGGHGGTDIWLTRRVAKP